MRKLRYFVIAVAVVIVALLVLPFVIDANAFRPTIQSKLSAALGRDVRLGNLSLSILAGGLAAEDLTIADDPAFSKTPFLQAKSLRVGVELLPLIFSRAVRVTSLKISQPEVVLLRSPRGDWNFSSLGGASSPKNSNSATPDFSVKELLLSEGRVTVGTVGSAKQTHYDDVTIELRNFSQNSSFPFVVSAKLPGGGTAKIEGTAGPLDKTNAALTPLDAKVDINGLDLAATGFVDPASGIAGLVDHSGTFSSKKGRATARGQLKATRFQLVKGGSPSGVPLQTDYSSTYDLVRSVGTIEQGTVRIGNAVAHLAGTYDTRGDSTVLNLKMDGQNMPLADLQKMLPALGIVLPSGAALDGGTLNADLGGTGPLDHLVTTGTMGVYKTRLTGFDLGSRMSAIAALAGLKTGSMTAIDQFSSNLRLAPEGLRAENVNLVLPAIGVLTGNGTVTPGNVLNFKMLARLNSSASAVGVLTTALSMGNKSAGIPFIIQGTTSNPKFIPDVGGMLKSTVGSTPSNLNSTMDKLGLTGLFGKKKK